MRKLPAKEITSVFTQAITLSISTKSVLLPIFRIPGTAYDISKEEIGVYFCQNRNGVP